MEPDYKIESLKEVPKILKKEEQITTIIFDLGDTLYTTYKPEVWEKERDKKLWQQVVKQCPQLNLSFEEYIAKNRTYLEKLNKQRRKTFTELKFETFVSWYLKMICPRFKFDLFEKFCNIYRQFALDQAELKPYTLSALRILKKRKYKLGIITNTWHNKKHIEDILDKLKIKNFFEVIIVSSEFGTFKPHPAIFKKALSELKSKLSETIFVGNDLEADIYGAKNLKMKTVLLDNANY